MLSLCVLNLYVGDILRGRNEKNLCKLDLRKPVMGSMIERYDYVHLLIFICRLGGVVVAATHLMALAINHWIGIVRPLQYEATMTRGTAFRVIVISWVSPILILLLYFSSVQGQGFQSPNCRNCDFMQKLTFRVIFASFFFAPLAIMIFIYWHIFIIVRSHIHYRKQYVRITTCLPALITLMGK